MTINIEPILARPAPNLASQASSQPNIVEYARHLEAVYRRWEDLKGLEGLDLSAAISEIEKCILATPAATGADAAIQIMLIYSLVEQLRVDRGSAKEELLDRLEGLTTSALSGLIRELDLDLSELGSKRYMPNRGRPACALR